jgi:hypothetical protein
MHGDFSRVTFDPRRHFSTVLFQQGRVLLDANFNEQSAILLHYLRTLVTDLIGPAGYPAALPDSFAITGDTQSLNRPDLLAGAGRYYVGGVLGENEAFDIAGRPREVRYYAQPDAYFDRERADDRLPAPPFLVYLRVWEQQVTQDVYPGLLEAALGSHQPDSASRAQVVWQLLVAANQPDSGDPFDVLLDRNQTLALWPAWEQALNPPARERGLLAARARRTIDIEDDPCVLSPDSVYRGAENQLYRVEVHTGGAAGAATFKWSRDNGSVVYPIEDLAGNTLVLTSLGRDRRTMLDVNDWVEVIDAESLRRGQGAPLRQVTDIDLYERRVTLDDEPRTAIGAVPERDLLLRRWDQRPRPDRQNPPPDNALWIEEPAAGRELWLPLEADIQVQFTAGGEYRPGDYWLIPARVATGDVEWPREAGAPLPLPPHGTDYRFAPLALVRAWPANAGDPAVILDLRTPFGP